MRNILKKKDCANKTFTIVSVGKTKSDTVSKPLHINKSESNNAPALESHYKAMIDKGLDADKIELVVTDMLAAYKEVVKSTFPGALHQWCVFHVIQLLNGFFKHTLKEHRHKTFKAGERKAAHKTSFLILKGQEKLTDGEKEEIISFCERFPDMAACYALKEDIRMLYAYSETEIQAVAFRDILIDQYENKIPQSMNKVLDFLVKEFEPTISYLKVGALHSKTNNDAERIMRKIKQMQKVHYCFRKDENFMRHIKVLLGLDVVVAA